MTAQSTPSVAIGDGPHFLVIPTAEGLVLIWNMCGMSPVVMKLIFLSMWAEQSTTEFHNLMENLCSICFCDVCLLPGCPLLQLFSWEVLCSHRTKQCVVTPMWAVPRAATGVTICDHPKLSVNLWPHTQISLVNKGRCGSLVLSCGNEPFPQSGLATRPGCWAKSHARCVLSHHLQTTN